MEHDAPTLLFSLAAEYLISAKTIRPGVVILAKMVASARTGARALTWEKVVHLLTGQRCDDLNRLLMADAGLAVTRLAWLTTPGWPVTARKASSRVGLRRASTLMRSPGGGQPAGHGGQARRQVGDGQDDPARCLIDNGLSRAERGQRTCQLTGVRAGCGLQVQPVSPGPVPELAGRAAGDDRTAVDDHDRPGEPLGRCSWRGSY